ncbi:large conductance mechanosensitive channel protein MscL [Nigerium massiliense]|uniref:large conductance mechanosensitive channel protein MscL n=1 Tax=Nigerium massiliense TaxID=1522317 RepID=UPI00058B60CB|nr:large conductance mechanosensitive channel protein MscL [Nigerium massiliense]
MKGFKEFLMQGNLIDLAVAFIMGTAFASVVTTFTAVIMDVIGKFVGFPNFSNVAVGGINIGAFLTALVSFIILAAVVYFAIVKPYNAVRARFSPAEEVVTPTTDELLVEIRDLLANRR